MATYSLQRAASGFIPPAPDGGGAFTIGFPLSIDQNLPQPYQPAVGDVILLGYIPRGFLVLSGWLEAAMSGSGTSTWFFGTGSASDRLSNPVDVAVSGTAARYYFLKGVPAVFIGEQVLPAMTLVQQVLFTMTCNTVTGTGNLTGSVALRGTMDYANSAISPAGGGQPGGAMGVSQLLP